MSDDPRQWETADEPTDESPVTTPESTPADDIDTSAWEFRPYMPEVPDLPAVSPPDPLSHKERGGEDLDEDAAKRETNLLWPVTYGRPVMEPAVDDDATGEVIVFDEESGALQSAPDPTAALNDDALPEPPGWGRRLRSFLFGATRQEHEDRLLRLSHAIAQFPDSPANYVLRGEVYLKLGEYAPAAEDFRTALALAETQFNNSDWGIVAQVMRDRARAGLRKVEG